MSIRSSVGAKPYVDALRRRESSIVWRYGKMKNGSDFTDLDQWISDRWLEVDAPEAPAALKEAIEGWLEQKEYR